MVEIAIGGIAGRMGQAVVEAVARHDGMHVAGGVARQATTGTAMVVSEIPAEVIAIADVFIDFSVPAALPDHLAACVSAGVPYISGVTGLDDSHRESLRAASARIPVFHAANFSVGGAVVAELVRLAAGWLADADVEVVDLHHRRKVDAPSGTALVLLDAIDSGRRESAAERRYGRNGHSPRQQGEIGVHSLRGGGNAGEHQVLLASEGEEVWIGHRALSRATFADGALRAARWLIDQPLGIYGMRDLLAGQ